MQELRRWVLGAVVAGLGSRITLSAPASATVAGRTYVFDRWSDGGAAGHEVVVPGTAVTYSASYSPK